LTADGVGTSHAHQHHGSGEPKTASTPHRFAPPESRGVDRVRSR
jgi:hypothetical protein